MQQQTHRWIATLMSIALIVTLIAACGGQSAAQPQAEAVQTAALPEPPASPPSIRRQTVASAEAAPAGALNWGNGAWSRYRNTGSARQVAM